VDRLRRARLRRRHGARLPAAGRCPRPVGAPGRRALHRPGRRPGLALRAERPGRRAAAGPLRAERVAVRQPAVRPAGEPGPADLPAQGQPVRRRRRRPLPVRDDHLPAHRAPHRRRHVTLPGPPGRAPAGHVLRGQPRAGGRAGPAQRRVGHHHLAPHDHRGPGARDRPDAVPDRAGSDAPPGGPPLPLGLEGPLHRRRGQRPLPPGPRPQRPHPGGQGRHLRYRSRSTFPMPASRVRTAGGASAPAGTRRAWSAGPGCPPP
jgi:hypothetical protein